MPQPSPRVACRSCKPRCSSLLPDGLEYVPGSTALDGTPAADPAAQNGSLRFVLGEVAADSAPRVSFATRGTGDAAGEHSMQALLRFTTALGRAERTPPVANVVHRNESDRRTGQLHLFAALQRVLVRAAFRPATNRDRRARRRGARAHRSRVARHARAHDPASSATRIRHRSRHGTAARFPDNHALSAARAQAVADYLRSTLPDARIEIEGRGADEPLDAGTDADSLARNRRVEIEVAGVRTLAAAETGASSRRPRSRPPSPRRARSAASRRAAARARLGTVARSRGRAGARDRHCERSSRSSRSCSRATASRRRCRPSASPIAHLPEQQVRLSGQRPTRQRAELRRHGAERREVRGPEPLARRRPRGRRQPARRNGRSTRPAPRSPCSSARCATAAAACAPSSSPRSRSLTADGRTQPVIALRVFDALGRARAARHARRVSRRPAVSRLGGRSRRCTTTRCSSRAAASRRSPSTKTAWCASCSSRRPKRAPSSFGCASTSARSKRSAPGSSPSSATGSWSGSRKAPSRTTQINGSTRAARRRRGLLERRPGRVLRQGPRQGLDAADDRVRLGARPPASSRIGCSARSSPTATTRCTATPSSSASRPRRRASCI